MEEVSVSVKKKTFFLKFLFYENDVTFIKKKINSIHHELVQLQSYLHFHLSKLYNCQYVFLKHDLKKM